MIELEFNDGIAILTNDDDIIDLINSFPKAKKETLLKSISKFGIEVHTVIRDSSNRWWLLSKLAVEGDSGLVAVCGLNKEVFQNFINSRDQFTYKDSVLDMIDNYKTKIVLKEI